MVTDPSGSVLSWNATFATKAEAQAHGTAKGKEFKAMVAGGFMPCSVRELLDRWRREVAPLVRRTRSFASFVPS
jgi:hypothetical protein